MEVPGLERKNSPESDLITALSVDPPEFKEEIDNDCRKTPNVSLFKKSQTNIENKNKNKSKDFNNSIFDSLDSEGESDYSTTEDEEELTMDATRRHMPIELNNFYEQNDPKKGTKSQEGHKKAPGPE